jgi:hypothetical protein
MGSRPTRAELLAALSVAIDLGLGQPTEHMLRSALIATRIADRLGLSKDDRECTYYATLIMWIGCHADSHEYARWFGDDISVRHDSYLVDWKGWPYQRFLLSNVGRGEPWRQRLKTMSDLYVNARGQLSRLMHSHCTSAALLADRMGLPAGVQTALRFAFERYDGGGLPDGASGDAIPIQTRVGQLADMAEVHHRTYGVDRAIAMASSTLPSSTCSSPMPRKSWPTFRTCGTPRCAKRPTGTSLSTTTHLMHFWSCWATSST